MDLVVFGIDPVRLCAAKSTIAFPIWWMFVMIGSCALMWCNFVDE
jgi:hypothetical protein